MPLRIISAQVVKGAVVREIKRRIAEGKYTTLEALAQEYNLPLRTIEFFEREVKGVVQ